VFVVAVFDVDNDFICDYIYVVFYVTVWNWKCTSFMFVVAVYNVDNDFICDDVYVVFNVTVWNWKLCPLCLLLLDIM
jgi:hypothetical protein